MKFGFTSFDINRDEKKVIGHYTFIEREKADFIVSRDSYYDEIEEAEDNQTEVFFEYDLNSKTGYYLYPVSEEENFSIQLKNLSVLHKTTELDRIIKYDKSLKYIDFTFRKIITDFSRPLIINGDLPQNIMINDASIEITDYFLLNIRNNTGKFSQSFFKDSILSELQILNSIMDENKYPVSIYTREFLSTFINNMLDKGFKAERYRFIIEKFEEMIEKKSSEGEWQNFIFQNYRFIFPEYLFIDKEFQLLSIDDDKKFVDFLLRNQSSDLLLEIKLPSLKVMSDSKDRNNYYFTATANKAILQAHRYYVTYKHEKFDGRRDRNVKIILLMGWKIESSDDNKINNDFELIRSMYKNIEIMTYSELLDRLKNLYEMVVNQ